MRFCKAVPRVASLPELRTYNCKRCGVTVNGSGGTERAARPLILVLPVRRAASLGSLHWAVNGAKGGDPGMATQITSKNGFTDNFWLQMAALVIVTLVVIALAAEYVW